MKRPYDEEFMEDMDSTALHMCAHIQGTKLAFVQSDEISLLLTDFDSTQTDAWFDGSVQKMASIAASEATVGFNMARKSIEHYARFDARVFTIPDPVEVENYFIWRQQDATRNSIQMTAQSVFSHKELHGMTCDQAQEMMWSQKGINWNDYPIGFKRGRCVVKETYSAKVGDIVKESQRNNPKIDLNAIVERTRWVVSLPPVFTQSHDYLAKLIPHYA